MKTKNLIGVIIPTFNRLANLRLALMCLERQTVSDFHVVVADDGSTDDTRGVIEMMAKGGQWKERLKWVGCGKNQGARSGRARNIAAANLSPLCRFMIMIDSDSLLGERAVERYLELHCRYPEAIILGTTDWLPPLPHEEIKERISNKGLSVLRKLVPKGKPKRVQGTFVGHELRKEIKKDLFTDKVDNLQLLRPEWSLPLNSGYPLNLFWSIGGFDETFKGYGYEDIELGIRAHKQGINCLAYSKIWSFHVWHSKTESENWDLENQKNLHYTLIKHGADDILESEVNWSYWWHYHRLRGGNIVLSNGILWAVNQNATHKMKIPTPEWVNRLGFYSFGEIKRKREIESAIDVGNAQDTIIDSEIKF